jgi:hypothetical protein
MRRKGMSQYHLDIKGNIGLSDYSNISDYLELVDTNDNFTITLDSIDTENVNLICSMLQDKDFIVTSQVEGRQGKVYIGASRKR